MARRSRQARVEEFIVKGEAILATILANTKPKVYKKMMKRFNAESSTRTNGVKWETLSPFYVKYVRRHPNEKILVQKGDLKSSIDVVIDFDPPSGGNFFTGIGNDLAHQHNDGYTFTAGERKVNVPARPCTDIPEEYDDGGALEKKMIFKWFKELNKLKIQLGLN